MAPLPQRKRLPWQRFLILVQLALSCTWLLALVLTSHTLSLFWLASVQTQGRDIGKQSSICSGTSNTLDKQLTYSSSASKELFVTYSDADYAGDSDTMRSTGAYVVIMGGGAVNWSSKLQPVVAQSTTEAVHCSQHCWQGNCLDAKPTL